MDKPTVNLGNLEGPEGNVFVMAGKVAAALVKAGLKVQAKEFRNNLWRMKSYEEALILMKEYVNIE